MEFPNNGTPDLAAILKTLSSFNTPQPCQSQTPANDSNPDNTNRTPATITSNQSASGTDRRAPQDLSASSRQVPEFGSQGKSSVDPSIITTWPTAIKCVMKTVAQNEGVQYRIRRLIATQHEHEKSWWQARQRLIAKQKARAGNQKKLDEVLRAVGGKVANQPHEAVPQEDELEIKQYDEKVYKASAEMTRALDSELKALGIPFFAIKQELIRSPSSDDSSSKQASINNGTDNCITQEEVALLRLRMLELLQDLCKE